MGTRLRGIDVFFDLDGTLVDAKYRLNAPVQAFRDAVSALGPGTRIHLNSNRSLSQLQEYYDLFGFSGAIILENGCCYFDPENQEESPSCVPPFDRRLLVDCLGTPVVFAPTDPIVDEEEQQLPDGDFVFAEIARTFTMTLYPRRVMAGKPVEALELLLSTAEAVTRVYPEYEVTIDQAKYWNVLLKPKGIVKATLLPQLSSSSHIASFGDTKDDVCMFECSEFCGAPANASAEAKQAVRSLGGVVTSGEYTRGAIEFLQRLAEVAASR